MDNTYSHLTQSHTHRIIYHIHRGPSTANHIQRQAHQNRYTQSKLQKNKGPASLFRKRLHISWAEVQVPTELAVQVHQAKRSPTAQVLCRRLATVWGCCVTTISRGNTSKHLLAPDRDSMTNQSNHTTKIQLCEPKVYWHS